jgi:hypothetical protein
MAASCRVVGASVSGYRLSKIGWQFILTIDIAADNLVRLPKALAVTAWRPDSVGRTSSEPNASLQGSAP